MIRKIKYECLANCTCFNIRKANRMVTQLYDHALKPVGIKATQFSILGVLANIGETTMNDLSSILKMERTTLTRSLERLENEKLVVSREGEDARKRLVQLTQRGYLMLDSALPHWQKAQAIMQDGLGASFADLLGILKDSENLASKSI